MQANSTSHIWRQTCFMSFLFFSVTVICLLFYMLLFVHFIHWSKTSWENSRSVCVCIKESVYDSEARWSSVKGSILVCSGQWILVSFFSPFWLSDDKSTKGSSVSSLRTQKYTGCVGTLPRKLFFSTQQSFLSRSSCKIQLKKHGKKGKKTSTSSIFTVHPLLYVPGCHV